MNRKAGVYLIGNLIGFLRNRHRFHDWVADMLSTTPSLTLQVNGILNLSHGICTANPAAVDHLLCSNFHNYVKGTRFQSVLHDLLGHDIFNADGEIWTFQRKSPAMIQHQVAIREAIKVIDDFAMEIIRLKERELESKQEKGEVEYSRDLLSRFMGSTLNVGFGDQGEKRKFLKDIVISFVLAGKEATSTALTWFFWLISGHPQCKHLIYKELSSVATQSEEWSGNFNYNELKSFHYLQAALSESMRLFPPVPINSRLTMRDDVLPDGTQVGQGWFADYSAYAMGRMERLWGPDCREYKPERWLDNDGVYQPPDQFKFPVFHCGPRMCLGKEMAYVQMKSIAAVVMSKFEVEAVDGGGSVERMMKPTYTLSLLLKMKDGLKVRLKSRR